MPADQGNGTHLLTTEERSWLVNDESGTLLRDETCPRQASITRASEGYIQIYVHYDDERRVYFRGVNPFQVAGYRVQARSGEGSEGLEFSMPIEMHVWLHSSLQDRRASVTSRCGWMEVKSDQISPIHHCYQENIKRRRACDLGELTWRLARYRIVLVRRKRQESEEKDMPEHAGSQKGKLNV